MSSAAAIGRGRLLSWGWVPGLVALLYLAFFEQGGLTGGIPVLHELFHDGRHMLGVPCH